MKKKFVILFFIIFMNKIVWCGEVDVVTVLACRICVASSLVALFTGIGLWCREHKTIKRIETLERQVGEKMAERESTFKRCKSPNEMSFKENIINFLSLGMKSFKFEADGN